MMTRNLSQCFMPRISCTKPEQFLVDCGRPNIRVSINFDHFKSKQLKVIYCFKPENDCNLSKTRKMQFLLMVQSFTSLMKLLERITAYKLSGLSFISDKG